MDLDESFVGVERGRAGWATEDKGSIGVLEVGVDPFGYVFGDLQRHGKEGEMRLVCAYS